MISGTYQLANLLIRIDSIYDEVHRLCRDYAAAGEPLITVSTTEADIEAERKQSELTRQAEELPPYDFPDSYLETLAVYRQIATQALAHDCLLMHGSTVAVDGTAYLFTARSGTGKSTHVRLWRELFGERAVMVNDDKPLLTVTSEKVTVHGTPWDGKHHLSSNISVPLRAICILTRSEDNHIREIAPREALEMLLKQTYHPADPISLLRVLELLDKLSHSVRFYLLGCNMQPEAAIVSAEGMGAKAGGI